MGSLNKVQIIGRLGRDPETRTLPSGDRLANLRVAVTETWKDKNTRERKERTEWVAVTVFNDALVKICENYLRKGSNLYLEGSLQTKKIESNGQEKYITEVVITKYRGDIVLLDKASHGDGDSGGGGMGRPPTPASGGSTRASFPADLDDDIPFICRDSSW